MMNSHGYPDQVDPTSVGYSLFRLGFAADLKYGLFAAESDEVSRQTWPPLPCSCRTVAADRSEIEHRYLTGDHD